MRLRFLSPLHKANRQLAIHLEERMGDLGIQAGEGHLLSYLRAYEPSPISELLRVFGHKKSTFTGRLDRLAVKGLITREVNPRDRRSFLVALTAVGRRRARQVDRVTEELEKRIAAHIGPGDLEGFERVLSAIAEVTAVEVRPPREN